MESEGPEGGSEPPAAWERPTSQLPVERGPIAASSTTAYEQRLHLLEMSSVFWALGGGPLRAVARRMRDLAIPAGLTLRLKPDGLDTVIFVASGACDRIVADTSGRVLLTKRSMAGEQIVLPPPDDRVRFTMSIRAVADAIFVTVDRDSLVQSLGTDFAPVAAALDKVWAQDVNSFDISAPGALEESGQVVAISSAKGGSGATTIAVNVAAAMGANHTGQILLLDLSVPYGHAALIADLVVTGSIVSASYAKGADFPAALRNSIVRHPGGLVLLPGALRPEETDLLTGELIGRALTELVALYRVIVVDLGTSLAEAALAVIERARRVVLIVPPEIAALTDVRRAMAVYTDLLQIPDARIDMVLNQRVPRPPLGRDGVESILRRAMSVCIGYDGSKPEEAALAGSLLLHRDPESVLSRGATELAALLSLKVGLEA